MTLKGAAAQILWDQDSAVNLKFNDLVQCLKQRYGSESQNELLRMELVLRRRRKNARTAALYADSMRLITLAYSRQHGAMSDIHVLNAFLAALDDNELELRIRKKDLKNLEKAAATETRLDVYNKVKAGAQNSRKIRSAVIPDDKTEMDKAFKKGQDERRRMQDEIRKIYEENKRSRMMLGNSSGVAWPSSGSINVNETSGIQPVDQYAYSIPRNHRNDQLNEYRRNQQCFHCHQADSYSRVPETTSCAIRRTSSC